MPNSRREAVSRAIPRVHALSRIVAVAGFCASIAACGGGGGSSSGGPDPIVQIDSVALTATGPTASVPSQTNTTLEFVVANPGSTAASNVVLKVSLGSGLFQAGIQCEASSGATCPDDARTMTVATLPAGGRLKYAISVIPNAGATGTITTTASVTASNDQLTGNNAAQVDLTAYSADVRVLGTVEANELRAGSTVVYSFTVENAGPDAAQNVALQQTLSSVQTVPAIECTASNGATCPASVGPEMVLPTLPVAGTLKFSVSTQLTKDAIASISGSMITTSLGDGLRSNNRAPVSAKTRMPVSPGTPSFIELQSDAGDFVGTFDRLGRNFSYTLQNSTLEVQTIGGQLVLRIAGDERWEGRFFMPDRSTRLEPGEYVKSIDFIFYDPESGGFVMNGPAGACPQSGWFIIDDVVYNGDELQAIDLRFEQHCNELEPALRGQVHWVAGEATRPPGPVNPPPPGLWHPPANSTPMSGSYFYVESDPGDTAGGGRTETFTQVNSVISVTHVAGQLSLAVAGDRRFAGSFVAMAPLTTLPPGYYGDAQGTGGNPAVGRFSVAGDFACGTISGWFVVDSISYNGDVVTGVDLRFEQRCGVAVAALRGKLHWRSDDPTRPAGPQNPPPTDLWTPPTSALPATGNVVYLESDVGDFIGQGLVKAYTPLNSVITIGGGGFVTAGNRFQLTVEGDEDWQGYFQGMYTLPDLEPGYYGHLSSFFAPNTAFGSIGWMGEGRACDAFDSWFVIDDLAYSGSTLTAIEMRFEQRCGVAGVLHGYIRWSASDTRAPPPPQNPPPAGLWTPPAGATPATGNYLYFESDPDDFIGRGATRLFTRPATTFALQTDGSLVSYFLQEAGFWHGYFQPMVPLTQLQVGYYGDLTEINIAKGLLAFEGDGRGCPMGAGWFVVDDVRYAAGELTSLTVRFEQRCKASTGSLRGKLHWQSSNT